MHTVAEGQMSRRVDHRAVARRVAELVVIGAVLAPAVRDRDSFPLSTYPMYAFVRDREVELGTARAVDAAGGPVHLSMTQIAATDDPLVAVQRVRDAIVTGAGEELCVAILRRAPAAAEVVVVTERHDVIDAARGEPSLVASEEHARCAR